MKSNRELDALIAEHVMGYEIFKTKNSWTEKENRAIINGYITRIPSYSTDIKAAMSALDKFENYTIKKWVDEQYVNGRTTVIRNTELRNLVAVHFPNLTKNSTIKAI